jgi:hypothetical protein
VEVHIGISKRSASDGVTTDSDGGHGSNSVEHLKEESLSDFGMKVSHVKGGRLERSRLSRNHFLWILDFMMFLDFVKLIGMSLKAI